MAAPGGSGGGGGGPSYVSSGNSTTTAITGSATFTGTWERVEQFASISIMCSTSGTAQLFADFSQDGSTAARNIELSRSDVTDQGIHPLIPVAKYFRVRIVDTSTSSNTPACQVLYNSVARIAQPTSRLGQTVGLHSDVLNVRNLTTFDFDVANTRRTDLSSVHRFGDNPAVADTEEDLWELGGVFPWLIAAETVRIKAGGNAADTAAGAGAQKVKIYGLDENWAIAEEEVATNGASASGATTTTFIRVNLVEVVEVGAYHVANTAAIVIEGVSTSTVLAECAALLGKSEMAQYTIPAGHTGYLRAIVADVDGNKSATVRLWAYYGANDVAGTTYVGAKRLVQEIPELKGEFSQDRHTWEVFPAYTDIWMSAIGPGAGAAVSGDFEIVLEKL